MSSKKETGKGVQGAENVDMAGTTEVQNEEGA